MIKLIRLLFLTLLLCASFPMCAQRVALRTNALEWVALSPNMAVEARLSRRVTLDLSMGGCPFSSVPFLDNYKWRHFRVTPSLRYWFNRPMARHFLGVNLSAAVFSVRLKDRCYKGDMFSAGIDYGYDLVLSHHWNLEFLAGIGLGKARGYDWRAPSPQPKTVNMSRWVPVPRLGVSFTYVFN